MNRKSDAVNLAVLDANPLLAEGLCALLNSDGAFYASAYPLEKGALAGPLAGVKTDIVLIDPSQSVGTPEEISSQLSEIIQTGAVIGYCADASVELARQLLAVGFRGFVPKTAQFATLRAALDVVAAGGVYLDAAFAPALLGVAPPALMAKSGAKPLSEREMLVLKSVALGMSMKEIGTAMDLSSKTVETYKARASSKLQLQGRREIVDFAIRNGWVQAAV